MRPQKSPSWLQNGGCVRGRYPGNRTEIAPRHGFVAWHREGEMHKWPSPSRQIGRYQQSLWINGSGIQHMCLRRQRASCVLSSGLWVQLRIFLSLKEKPTPPTPEIAAPETDRVYFRCLGRIWRGRNLSTKRNRSTSEPLVVPKR